MQKQRLAIFASGTGSNAVNLINYFKEHEAVDVCFVLTNNPDAPIIKSATNLDVPVKTCTNEELADGGFISGLCKSEKVDWIILAGYLRLIPTKLINQYPDRIINLHPSLLPKYGGKGMYGSKVHSKVLENKESKTGITIHFVDEQFDTGKIIAQFSFEILKEDTLSNIQSKISELEQRNLPTVVENTITSFIQE